MSNRSKRRAEERANNNEAGQTGDTPEGTEGAGDAPVTEGSEVTDVVGGDTPAAVETVTVEGKAIAVSEDGQIDATGVELLQASTEVVREAKSAIDAIAEEEQAAIPVMEFVQGEAVGPGIPEQFYALLKADEGFAQTWFHNLAMAFRDEGCPTLVAQRGAAQFMGRCGVDVTGAEWFKSHMAQF